MDVNDYLILHGKSLRLTFVAPLAVVGSYYDITVY